MNTRFSSTFEKGIASKTKPFGRESPKRSGRYRIRLGDYRVGLKLEGLAVIFMRLLHRKDIYRYFP